MNEEQFFIALEKHFYDLKLWFQNNGYMKPVGDTPSSTPKVYKIADGSCNRCNGLISWDDYDKETHPYPTHIDSSGNELPDGCPEYNPTQ